MSRYSLQYWATSISFAIVVLLAESVIYAGESIYAPEGVPLNWLRVRGSEFSKKKGVDIRDPEDSDRPLGMLSVSEVDVDGDGTPDLIVSFGSGGTAGPYVAVYHRDKDRYRIVLEEQGGLTILPMKKGVARIECWSRSGGMEARRTVYRFSGKTFVEEFSQQLKGPFDGDRYEVLSEKRSPPKRNESK